MKGNMDGDTSSFHRVLSLLEQSHAAFAEAATLLRDTVHNDELAIEAMRLEAGAGVLLVRIRRAAKSGPSD